MRRSEILVGLDLGSSRIKVVVADTADRELPEILGMGEADSLGIEAGVIVNMERAALSIRSAVEDAEESAEVDIGRVLVTLDGEHIKGIDSRGVVAVSRTGGEIARAEVSAVLDAAKTLALPVGRTILDAKAQEFFVDGQRGIRDPIGMSGVRLGSKVHIVTASQQAVDNVVRAVRRAGLKLSGFPAWWLWRTVYFLKMPGLSRKIRVALDWTLGLLFPRDHVQLGVIRGTRRAWFPERSWAEADRLRTADKP